MGWKAIWRSVLAAALLLGGGPVQTAELSASDVMAAYLRYIAELTSWPEDSGQGDQTGTGAARPIVIGVVGDDPNGVMLPIRARVASEDGLLAQNRPIQIVDVQSAIEDGEGPDVLATCALLFLSEDAGADWESIQAVIDALPIITVSELEDFTGQGGMVEFFVDRQTSKVRMKVNLPVVQEAGITISARILALESVTVIGEQEDHR